MDLRVVASDEFPDSLCEPVATPVVYGVVAIGLKAGAVNLKELVDGLKR